MAAVTFALSQESRRELVAGACALVSRERNTPSSSHFTRKLAELGRALGFEAHLPGVEAALQAEVIWSRAGHAPVRIVVCRDLVASQVLRAVPTEKGGRAFLVVTGAQGVTAQATRAIRAVLSRSRPNLKPDDVTIIWAPANGCGRVLAADLASGLLEGLDLAESKGAADTVGANPWRDEADFPLFPYDRLRDGQRALMRDVRAALEARKVLVAHAPTGIGKTAAVLAAALEVARIRGKTVFFLTSRQTQHAIAVETLRAVEQASGEAVRVVDLISKQSMCPRPERPEHSGAFYEWCSHLCETKRCQFFLKSTERARDGLLTRIQDAQESVKNSARLGCCPHKVALEAGREAEVVICDYNALFDPGNSTLDRMGREPGDLIVVVDEAHNLPDRIRDAAGARIGHALLTEAQGELHRESPELAHAVDELTKVFASLLSTVPEGKEVEVTGDALTTPLLRALSTSLVPMTYDQLADELQQVSRKIVAKVEGRTATLEVAAFLRAWRQPEKDTLRLASRADVPALSVTLLDPASVAGPLFASVHAAVLMSGTLYPMALSADLLGIALGARMLESYPSPFLNSRRPVLLLRGVSTRYKARGRAMFERIAGGVAAAARATPGNVAVFFPSYRLRDEVAQSLPHRLKPELVLETREMTRGEKERLVGRLQKARSKGGALFLGVMGGSFSEGVDFYDGILQAVVVVGLPLAPPSKEVDALIGYFERKFGHGAGETYAYLNPAITRVLQAAGRLIRREEDRGVVVLMDERLEQVRYARLLPPDFDPRAIKDAEELGRAVAEFFAREG